MLLEVKEEENNNRISMKRLTQIPKMRRFAMASGKAGFLINHWNSPNPFWVYVPLTDAMKCKNKPSLLTTNYERFSSVEEAFNYIRDNVLRS